MRSLTIGAIQLMEAEAAGSFDSPAESGGRQAAEVSPGMRALAAANIERAMRRIDEAAELGCDVVLLPEVFHLTGIPLSKGICREMAVLREGPVYRSLSDAAKKLGMTIVAPVLERSGERVTNAAWIFDRDGALSGTYAKVHPTREERGFGIAPGDGWPCFTLDWGVAGVMICHDNSFPESARCLALAGAEVIFWPHAQSGWGGVEWEITLRSRAIDNGVYLVAACAGRPRGAGWRPGMRVGRSSVVGPDGTVLADAGREEGIAVARVDLDLPVTKYGFTASVWSDFRKDVRADRRPDAYGPIVADQDGKDREE